MKPDSVLIGELAGEAVLLDIASGEYYGLNETGSIMWHTLVDGGRVRDAYDTLRTRYPDVEPRTLEVDFTTLIGELLELGLLEVAHG